MNIAQIEENVQKLVKSFTKETFIFDLLLSYGLPKASISRLQKGNLNLSKPLREAGSIVQGNAMPFGLESSMPKTGRR